MVLTLGRWLSQPGDVSLFVTNGACDTFFAYPTQPMSHIWQSVSEQNRAESPVLSIRDRRLKLFDQIRWADPSSRTSAPGLHQPSTTGLATSEWSSSPVLAANNRGRPQDSEHRPLCSLAYCIETFPLASRRGNSYTQGRASHPMMTMTFILALTLSNANWSSTFFTARKRMKFTTKPRNNSYFTLDVLPHYLGKFRSPNFPLNPNIYKTVDQIQMIFGCIF